MAHRTHGESSHGLGRHDFGADHHHKPTKAIVGVAILVVLSFAFYEFGGKPAVHSSAAPAQTLASSSH